MLMVYRIIEKCIRELYLFAHPKLWGHKVHINGIPRIENIENLTIGDKVAINKNAYLQCVGGITIGDSVTISYGVTMFTAGLNTGNWTERGLKPVGHRLAPIKIGNGVWLGANSMIMPGVTIAPNIIVCPGTVVAKSLDKEGWMYGGGVAFPIKKIG